MLAVVVEEAEKVATAAKILTPVDTGTLRSTGVVLYKIKAASIVATVVFGGPAAPYALAVHERLDIHHTTGQAKFLETAFEQARPRIMERFKNIFK